MKNNVIKYAGEGKSLFATNVLPLVKQYPWVTALGGLTLTAFVASQLFSSKEKQV